VSPAYPAPAVKYPTLAVVSQNKHKVITVFGSSRTVEGDTDYQTAMRLGKLLGEAGFDVCNGGYSGSMEAISRGVRDGGGKSIGVTVDVIARSGNAWLDEEIRTENIFRRIEHMVTLADGFAVLPGGTGTLAELALTANLLFLGALTPRPLVLLGAAWESVMTYFFDNLHSAQAERALVRFAPTPESVVSTFREHLA